MKSLIVLLLLILFVDSIKASTIVKPSVIESACKQYEAHDCYLVKAIIHTETRGRLDQVDFIDTNGKSSKGLMHVQELAAREAGLKYDFKQLSDNVMVGLKFGIGYINGRLRQNHYNIRRALAAYNAGRVIVCQNYNPGQCYPGEYWNHDYVRTVMRHYKYLVEKERPQFRVVSQEL